MFRLSGIVLIGLLQILPLSVTEAQDIDACGWLEHGVEAGCVIFLTDSGGAYLVGGTGSFGIGSYVHIVGIVDPTCVTICMQGPCLFIDSIASCVLDCCGHLTAGHTGNTDCSPDGSRTLVDITRLIDNVYISKLALCCPENGNVDGDSEGKINLADITRLIDHVYISKAETAACE